MARGQEGKRAKTYHVSRITFHVSTYYSQFTDCFVSLRASHEVTEGLLRCACNVAFGFQQILVAVMLCICFSFLSCGIKAPEDYYLHLLAMEKVGEQERREAGREIGEIITPEESLQPMVIALHPEQKALSSHQEPLNADLLKIIHTKTNTPEAEFTTEPSVSLATEKPESKPTPAMVPIGIDKEMLKQSLKDKNINIIGIVTKDGRLDGEWNLIQVHFASETMSDDALYEKFLYICAIIYGYDMGKNTVDTVMGFAIVEDFPYMVLEGKMEDYVDFANNKILYREWISRLTTKKLK